MGRKEATDALRPLLTKAIKKWLDDLAESAEWGGLDIYVGENTAGVMADAGMAVLSGMADSQQYLIDNGYLKT